MHPQESSANITFEDYNAINWTFLDQLARARNPFSNFQVTFIAVDNEAGGNTEGDAKMAYDLQLEEYRRGADVEDDAKTAQHLQLQEYIVEADAKMAHNLQAKDMYGGAK